MDYVRCLNGLLSLLKGQRKALNNELRKLQKGKLMISSNGKRLSFFDIGDPYSRTHPKGIGRDQDKVYQLARRAYVTEQIERINTNITLLEKTISGSFSLEAKAILEAMPKHFSILEDKRVIQPLQKETAVWPNPVRDPEVYPKKALLKLENMTPQEWAALPYRENTKNLERKIHRANKGFYTRSKSEVLITGEYDRREIYYHYDEVIEIDGKWISPDVIGLRFDGWLIYQEHLGLQDELYSSDTIRKLILYQKAGIVLGKNLFLTFDDANGAINMELIRVSIDTMFFPSFIPAS